MALIEDEKLPNSLRPYLSRLQALYIPPPRRQPRMSNSKLLPLPNDVLNLLVDYLNENNHEECIWIRPDEWALLRKSHSIGYSPVPARGQFYRYFDHTDGIISTFTHNPDNCCIYFKNSKGIDCFGRIFSIFSHSRASAPSQTTTDVWINVQCFPPLPSTHFNPFESSDKADVQTALRLWCPTKDVLIKINQVIAQCTWIMYKAGEMSKHVNVSTIGMIIQKR